MRKIPLVDFMLTGLMIIFLVFASVHFDAVYSSYSWNQQLSLSQIPDFWPTFHHDVERSGYVVGSAPRQPKSLWNFTVGGAIQSSPVIANDTVFFGSADGYLYAVNQTTGKMIWKTSVGLIQMASPVIYGDSIYVGSFNGTQFYRIRESSGEKVWGITIGSLDITSPMAVDGRIYVSDDADSSGKLYSIDALTGNVIWSFPLKYSSEMAYSGGLVYAGSDDFRNGSIYAINSSTGVLAWKYQTQWAVSGGLTISGGVLYGGGGAVLVRSQFVALNSRTGSLIWAVNTTAIGPPAIAYGKMFMQYGSAIGAVNQSNGHEIWVRSFRGSPISWSIPAVADGMVFAGGGSTGDFADPTIYAINATTGEIVWSFPVLGAANSSPAISNGTIYVGSGLYPVTNGTLFAIANQIPMPSSLITVQILAAVGGLGFIAIIFLLLQNPEYRRRAKVLLRVRSTK